MKTTRRQDGVALIVYSNYGDQAVLDKDIPMKYCVCMLEPCDLCAAGWLPCSDVHKEQQTLEKCVHLEGVLPNSFHIPDDFLPAVERAELTLELLAAKNSIKEPAAMREDVPHHHSSIEWPPESNGPPGPGPARLSRVPSGGRPHPCRRSEMRQGRSRVGRRKRDAYRATASRDALQGFEQAKWEGTYTRLLSYLHTFIYARTQSHPDSRGRQADAGETHA